MFEDIGNKIKTLAAVICALGVIASVIIGVSLSKGSVAIGFFIILFGIIISWCGTFLLYGFGELIDQTRQINKKLDRIGDNIARSINEIKH